MTNRQFTDHWARALAEGWGIEAELLRLDGEYDLNFLAETQDGADYVLKVMRPNCEEVLVDLQIEAFSHLESVPEKVLCPRVFPASDGEKFQQVRDQNGENRLVWMLECLPGRCYADLATKDPDLIQQIGRELGRIAKALASFEHEGLQRDFKWNLVQGDWIETELSCISDPTRRAVLEDVCKGFAVAKSTLDALPEQAIHNDANDYNILIESFTARKPALAGIIDLGDMCAAPRVCDLAIAGAYIVLDHPEPEAALSALVAGYHAAYPLEEDEVDLIWPLLRMRLAVSVVNSTMMALNNPDDPYVTISQAPAWRFLEDESIDGDLMTARLRVVCGLPVVKGADRVMAWLAAERGNFAPVMGRDLSDAPFNSISVEHSTWPRNPFDMPLEEAALVGEEFNREGDIWLGHYHEPRLVYTDKAFRKGPWKASARRTVHLGIDAFADAGHAIHAPMAGEVVVADYRGGHLDYGGVIILRHQTPQGDVFFTLYGHLDPEFLSRLEPGSQVAKGEVFCRLGDHAMNGGWSPHLHFQLAMSTKGIEADWPGVGDPDDMAFWRALCPNPAALMNLPDDRARYVPTDKRTVLADRKTNFAGNLSLTYADPVMLVRGWKHHLFDEWGRPYLDAYNNVPHVGHAHPRIQAVAADQLKRVNSNTRYLHPAQTAFAEKILSKMPDEFEVCFFVNSGSEANELALRLARAHSGAKGIVTPDHGYHGNTNDAVAISAYKFNKPGGIGKADWVELVEVADDYRGSFKRNDLDRAKNFANFVDPAIARLKETPHGFAGFIAETFPSVSGQIIPPQGYLAEVYRKVRAAGGICIADEVQTGLGRLGEYYFAFEHQGARPDIVVLGKPLGNGHPIGAVITTRAIADSFDNGIEFFSTFGGSTLSCRIGKKVLDIVDEEGLQENARIMGHRLLDVLRALQQKHPAIGDVRGLGLFVGVELIHPDGSEATDICAFVKNRMREYRILIGSDGPKDNILKIRPPLTIEADDVDMLVSVLDQVLSELDQV
ncbi:MAG: aminotransferase class III-fold pyridoxal phosphate-dependent enzyme [Pseudomonadota bacterium]